MFENFKERLQMVQQDFTAGFKTLGEKSKEAKLKRRSRTEDSCSHFTGGLEILHRYEENWFLLHRRTKDCAQAAEAEYGDIVMLSAHWERKRCTLTQLQEQLQSLPAFITELDAVTTNIAQLEGEFEELESKLVYLETICAHCDQQTMKQQHKNQIETYKKKKRKELESLEVELNLEHTQKLSQLEQAMQQKLKERQKAFEQAFKQDLDQYLSTGYLHSRESTGADVCALDQMTVTNISDQEALDDFLNSSDEDLSTASSSLTSGPDRESYSSESLSHDLPTNKLPPIVNAVQCQQEDRVSEDGDEPVVQSDQEDIDADGLQDVTTVHVSEDSDSAGDLPSE